MPPKSNSLAAKLAAREKKQQKKFRSNEDDADGFADEDMMANVTSHSDAMGADFDTSNNDSSMMMIKKLKKTSSFLPTAAATAKKKAGGLQKRGPLSEALSSGKYASRVRDQEDDDDDDDLLGFDEDYDDDEEDIDFNEDDFEDDFYGKDDEDDEDEDFPVAPKRGKDKKKSSSAAAEDNNKKASSKKKGRVGFAAMDESEIEGKLEDVDDIFGILDAASDDEDLIAGAEDEDEIAERIEMKKRDPTKRARKVARTDAESTGTGIPFEDDEDEARQMARAKEEDRDILQQIADLRQRQAEEKSGVALEESVGAAEQIRQAASILGSTYSALLRLRLKLQPTLSNALQFPQHYALSDFISSSSETKKSYSGLAKEMISTLTQALDAVGGGHSDRILVFNSSSSNGEEKKSNNNKNKSIDIDATYENYVRLVDQPAKKKIDATIEAVGKRVVLGPTEQKNKSDKVADLPLIDQIKGVMTGLTRLYNRAQKNRSHTHIYGHPGHRNSFASSSNNSNTNNDTERKKMIALGDIDEEIFDDADFARELIQRNSTVAASTINNNSSATNASADLALLKQSTNKSTRKGFHRKTKGRSVNYDPRPKLVGFMVPVACTQEEHQREALFRNIFAEA